MLNVSLLMNTDLIIFPPDQDVWFFLFPVNGGMDEAGSVVKLVYEFLHSPVTWTNWLSGWNDSNLCYEPDTPDHLPSISQSQEISIFRRFWTLTSEFRTSTIEFNSFTPSAYFVANNTGLGKQIESTTIHQSPSQCSLSFRRISDIFFVPLT